MLAGAGLLHSHGSRPVWLSASKKSPFYNTRSVRTNSGKEGHTIWKKTDVAEHDQDLEELFEDAPVDNNSEDNNIFEEADDCLNHCGQPWRGSIGSW